ncbi:MAG: CNNM domain-containing protein [Sedimentisphaerales bacterium]|jgi:putative hemolysin
MHSALIVLIVACFVMLGGLFSGSETGLYQLSRLRLRIGVEKRQLPFVILGRCLHDSSGLLLSLLIGNNLVNYLATSLVTSAFLGRLGAEYEHRAEIFATLVMVPVLFVFAEMIPKNLFFYRADVLMPFLSPVLYAFYKPLKWFGIVPLFKGVSSLFSRLAGLAASPEAVMTSAQRHKIQAILKDTHDEGILSPVQSDIVKRLVGISHVHIRAVMIPIGKVEMVRVESDRSALLGKLNKCAFTRLLVMGIDRSDVLGFVNIYETLGSSREFRDLRDFVKPIRELDADTTVTDAIHFMQAEGLRIILVTRAGRIGRARPIGIVTMKDLVEELLGDLAEW